MKKLNLFILVALALSMQSCLTTLLTLEALDAASKTTVVVPQPSTVVVTTPASKPVTTHVIVPNVHHADYLDLRAVAAAFSQASSIQQFEQILNSPAYMINNIDLNGDGFIDYIRVRETTSSYHHKYLLQAVLAAGWYVDVATIEVECSHYGYGVDYIKVIGGTSIYGSNYVYQPVFTGRPPMFDHIHGSNYSAWNSPYDWNHYPTYYEKPKPVSKEHYCKYVDAYMSHNKYTQEPPHGNGGKPSAGTPTTTTTTTTTTPGATTTTTTTTTTTSGAPAPAPNTGNHNGGNNHNNAPVIKQPTTADRTKDVVTRTTTTRVNSTTGRVSSNKVETRVPNSNGTVTRTVATTTLNRSGNTTTRTTSTTTPVSSATTSATKQQSPATPSSTSTSTPASTTNQRPQGGVRR